MITKELESKLVTAITSALASQTAAHQVVGSWQPVVDEDEATVAIVAVALGTPSMPTFSAPTVTFNGAVTLSVRSELDRDSATLVAFADALIDLFKTWQGATYQQAFTALDVTGLSVDEVSFQGGQPPVRSRDSRVTSVSFNFTLSGSYTD